MIKKYIVGALVALAIPSLSVLAATPTLTVSGSGTQDATVQVTGGEINSQVFLYYYSPAAGLYRGYSLGTTNASGTYSGFLNASTIGTFDANWSRPVYVQVGGYQSSQVAWPTGGVGTGGVMFSQTSPTTYVGGTGMVTLSGGTGSYYIASNSNSGAVSVSISGNTLSFYGSTLGQGMITVCATSGGCGTLTTTVSQSSSAPTVSNGSLTVTQGSQGSVTLTGGSTPYTISVPSGSGISTTLVGNTLYVNGVTTGSTVVQVCSPGGSCTPVSVLVQSANQTQTGTQMSVTLPMTVGQNMQLALSGGSGSYYLQSPVSSPVLASISGNMLVLNGQSVGSGMVTVCQTGGTMCLPIGLYVTSSVQPPLTGTGGGWLFDTDLDVGMNNQDVSELQSRLHAEGYFDTTPTGYFGSITRTAVIRYQIAHGISGTGYVGPLTRSMLNQ